MTKNQVPFHEDVREVHGLAGELFGRFISRKYQGENVTRHSFQREGRAKQYSLGPTTDSFQLYDWPQVLQPVLDHGYVPNKIITSRGGLRLKIVFENPDTLMDDPLDWDSGIWGSSTGLRPSIVFQGGLRPGSGFHFQHGLFRLICTNGLVVESLGLGSAHFTHLTFQEETLVESLFGSKVQQTPQGLKLLGAKVGTKAAAAKTLKFLQTMEGESFMLDDQPAFLRPILAPLADLPSPLMTEVQAQFQAMIDNAKRPNIFEADMANIVTSAENRVPKLSARAALSTLSTQKALGSLVAIHSL